MNNPNLLKIFQIESKTHSKMAEEYAKLVEESKILEQEDDKEFYVSKGVDLAQLTTPQEQKAGSSQNSLPTIKINLKPQATNAQNAFKKKSPEKASENAVFNNLFASKPADPKQAPAPAPQQTKSLYDIFDSIKPE